MKYQTHKDQQLRRVFATRAEFAAWREPWENGDVVAHATTTDQEFAIFRKHMNGLIAGFRNAYGPGGSPDENPPITRHQRERIHMNSLDYDYLAAGVWNASPDQVSESNIEVRLTIMADLGAEVAA